MDETTKEQASEKDIKEQAITENVILMSPTRLPWVQPNTTYQIKGTLLQDQVALHFWIDGHRKGSQFLFWTSGTSRTPHRQSIEVYPSLGIPLTRHLYTLVTLIRTLEALSWAHL